MTKIQIKALTLLAWTALIATTFDMSVSRGMTGMTYLKMNSV